MDIVGANLYHKYITGGDISIPKSHLPPANADLAPQTVQQMRGILVKTGVSKVERRDPSDGSVCCHSHRDFPINADLNTPYFSADNVLEAVERVLQEHSFL